MFIPSSSPFASIIWWIDFSIVDSFVVAADAEYTAGFSITAVVVDDTSAADAAVFAAAFSAPFAALPAAFVVFTAAAGSIPATGAIGHGH